MDELDQQREAVRQAMAMRMQAQNEHDAAHLEQERQRVLEALEAERHAVLRDMSLQLEAQSRTVKGGCVPTVTTKEAGEA